MTDAVFMALLVFAKRLDGVLDGVVVNELVTLWTQKHQIAYFIDVRGAKTDGAAGPLFAECNDVGYLSKVAFGQRDVMLEEKLVAAVKLAPSASPDKKKHRVCSWNL